MFLSAGELYHVLMGRSAASKLRRKSQREADELREQTYNKFFQDTLAMEEEELVGEGREEEEEVVFKRRRTVPDTPRASRANTPDPEEGEEDHRQWDKVLQLVKSVRDQIKALVLDNTNIRAACDDLRRQCHSQGVAFGDLSRLVNRTREDQEESGTYARNQSGHNPQIRQELLDAEGNLRAQDIGISWRDGETFLHGVRIAGQHDPREEDLHRPAKAEAYPSCQRDREDAYRRPAMSTPYQQSREQPPRCIEMSDTPAAHFAVPRQDAPRQTPGSRQTPNRDYRAPFKPRDYSRTKCFSCGQLGHTQVRCPKPDSSLPFRPSGWVDRSDGPRRNSGASPQGNEI